jgi:hypothetical protein
MARAQPTAKIQPQRDGLPQLRDSTFAAPVIASSEEILYAHELRRRLVQRYLNRPNRPVCLWCVGAD